MGFDVDWECCLCFLLKGYNEPYPPEKENEWRRLVCTHCLERCSLDSDWHKAGLHHRLLHGLHDALTDEVCSVCSMKRLLLFRLIVCDEHCGHFAVKTQMDASDSESDGEMPDLVDDVSVEIPATHVNPTEPLDYSDEDKDLPPLLVEEEKKLKSNQQAKSPVQSNGLTKAQSTALHLLAEEISSQLLVAAKRIVPSKP